MACKLHVSGRVEEKELLDGLGGVVANVANVVYRKRCNSFNTCTGISEEINNETPNSFGRAPRLDVEHQTKRLFASCNEFDDGYGFGDRRAQAFG
jgi:hypothetical protein